MWGPPFLAMNTVPRVFSTLLTNKVPTAEREHRAAPTPLFSPLPMLVPTGQCLNTKTGRGERNETKTLVFRSQKETVTFRLEEVSLLGQACTKHSEYPWL